MARLSLAVLTLASSVALGTVVLSLSFEELTARAPLVVHATVHGSNTDWDRERGKIWTWTELVVKDTLKGDRLSTVLVKQPGGIVGDVGQHVSGAATFSPGEEVVLFLEPAPDERGAWVPVSMSASKVTFEDRFGVRVARRDLSGLAFATPGKQYVQVDEREVVSTADAFLTRIRAAVKPSLKGGGK